MIITVNLNPAIDKDIEIENLIEGDINEIVNEKIEVAGKGINVAKVLKELNEDCSTITFFGGSNGRTLLEYLDKNNIRHEAIKTNGETRMNFKIHDRSKNIVTDINAKGPFIYENELNAFIAAIDKNLKSGDIIIFSGSVPWGINKDIYRTLITTGKERGAITFLDTDGEALEKGMEAKPYFIRHNIHELEKFNGIKINSIEEAASACKDLISKGIDNVYLSMGSEGTVFVNKTKVYVIEQLDVKVKSKVGTGDSFVAGMAYAYVNNYDVESAIKLASACATATLTKEGSRLGKLEDIQKYVDKIIVKELVLK